MTNQPCKEIENSSQLFFSDVQTEVDQAKALCELCSIRLDCLTDALIREEFAGVWGGRLFVKGKVTPRLRQAGRPSLEEQAQAAAEVAESEALLAASSIGTGQLTF